jgi:S1-C subfamily serine protease
MLGLAAVLPARQGSAQTWIGGEMGYRVTAIPDGSAAAGAGLRVADVLAEPQLLPDRLASTGPEGVEIPIFRFDRGTGRYARTTTRVTFAASAEKRLGTTGDLGFLITAVTPDSLGARSELKPGDFIPRIDETFVHSVNDLALVDAAYESGAQVQIYFTRWFPDSNDFKTAISHRRFVK